MCDFCVDRSFAFQHKCVAKDRYGRGCGNSADLVIALTDGNLIEICNLHYGKFHCRFPLRTQPIHEFYRKDSELEVQ
jgi:hypothetical protein